MSDNQADINKINKVKSWLKKFVIGLNLCPFAALPFEQDKIRYVVQHNSERNKMLAHFWDEIEMLDLEEHATSLIIYPAQYPEFLGYLDFYYSCEQLLEKYNRTEDYQLASFHPAYQFGGTEYSDVSNYTNRSPYPLIHILRSQQVEQAILKYGDTEKIFEQNIALMERMGVEGVRKLLIDN